MMNYSVNLRKVSVAKVAAARSCFSNKPELMNNSKRLMLPSKSRFRAELSHGRQDVTWPKPWGSKKSPFSELQNTGK